MWNMRNFWRMQVQDFLLKMNFFFISKTNIFWSIKTKDILQIYKFLSQVKCYIKLGVNINGIEIIYRWMFLILHTLN